MECTFLFLRKLAPPDYIIILKYSKQIRSCAVSIIIAVAGAVHRNAVSAGQLLGIIIYYSLTAAVSVGSDFRISQCWWSYSYKTSYATGTIIWTCRSEELVVFRVSGTDSGYPETGCTFIFRIIYNSRVGAYNTKLKRGFGQVITDRRRYRHRPRHGMLSVRSSTKGFVMI